MINMKIIQRGAEAILCLDKHEGKDVVVKERIKKGYRIQKLDEKIRKQRTKKESKLMERTRSLGVNVPDVIEVNNFKITMEYVDGERLKDVLNRLSEKNQKKIFREIGNIVSTLHEFNIVHGDLTTSNFILKSSKLYLIDFGLGKISHKTEDKATDLFLLYEALKSTHFQILEKSWKTILNIYVKKYSKAKEVMQRFEIIKRRRRYLGGHIKNKSEEDK